MGAIRRGRRNEGTPPAPRTVMPFARLPFARLTCLIVLYCWCCAGFAARVKPEVVEVEATGLETEVSENVLAHLSIAKLGEEGDETDRESEPTLPEDRVRRLHAVAPTEIEEALQPFGYYEPVVSSTLQRSDDGWLARYDVDPGEPTLLAEVEIRVLGEGRDEPAVREALDSIELSAGDVLQHPQYEAAKQRLFNAAYQAGYIDAAYERAEILVQRRERRADIHLVLDTGPKYYLR